jgi:hypothetical protein
MDSNDEKKVIREWPPDRPDAVDPLDRFSFERCLADATYAKKHEKEFHAAAQERKRRVIVEAIKERRTQADRQLIFSQLEREAAERQKRQTTLAEKERVEKEAYEKRRAKIVAGTRPWTGSE